MQKVSPALSAKKHVISGLITVAILLGGFGYWSVTANISGAIIASGEIEVEQNRQVVQHPEGGVVAAILVKNGDLVQAGDVLIRLDASALESQRKISEGSLFEILARRARMEAERDGLSIITFDPELADLVESRPDVRALTEGQVRLFNSRIVTLASQTSQLEKRIGQIGSQIDGLGSRGVAFSAQLTLLRAELTNQQILLEKGLTQASRVLELQRQEAAILGDQGNLEALRAEYAGRITEVEIEILRLSTQHREEAITQLRDLGFNQLELREKLHSLDQKLDRLNIRAPVSGIIHAMNIFVERAVISPGDPLLYLVPQDLPFLIAARVVPINVDEVFNGQDVMVRFASFDSRTTPELKGRVVSISADALSIQATGERFYRVEIRLLDGELERLPEGLSLIPGMPADAFIRTSDRTPLAYLIKPLADYFNKAFRE